MVTYYYPTYAGPYDETKKRFLYAAIDCLRNKGYLVVHIGTLRDFGEVVNKLNYTILTKETTNSIDEILALKELVGKNKVCIYTSEYHSLKIKLLTKIFGVNAEVIPVPTSYSSVDKIIKSILHTFHAMSAFSKKIYLLLG